MLCRHPSKRSSCIPSSVHAPISVVTQMQCGGDVVAAAEQFTTNRIELECRVARLIDICVAMLGHSLEEQMRRRRREDGRLPSTETGMTRLCTWSTTFRPNAPNMNHLLFNAQATLSLSEETPNSRQQATITCIVERYLQRKQCLKMSGIVGEFKGFWHYAVVATPQIGCTVSKLDCPSREENRSPPPAFGASRLTPLAPTRRMRTNLCEGCTGWTLGSSMRCSGPRPMGSSTRRR